MKLSNLLPILLLTMSLAGCFGKNIKEEQPLATVDHYIVCNIPESYFKQAGYPTREWDWTGKTDLDIMDFIFDHRKVIADQNTRTGKAHEAYLNCKRQAADKNKPPTR